MEAQRCKQCQQKSPSSAPDEEFCWLQKHRSSRHDRPHTRAERGCKKKTKASARLSFLPMFPLVYKGTLHTDMREDVFSKAVGNVECKVCRQAYRSGRISHQRFQSRWHLQSSSASSTLSCVSSLSACWAVYSFQCLAGCGRPLLVTAGLWKHSLSPGSVQ